MPPEAPVRDDREAGDAASRTAILLRAYLGENDEAGGRALYEAIVPAARSYTVWHPEPRIMFFDGWFDLLRILIVGASAYAGLIVMLRLSGKRTLSKMNAFDLIVTVSFGSTLATVLLSADVTLSEGLLAFALLCAMQYAVATLSVRSPRFQAFVKAQPALLFFRGSFQTATMVRERFTEEEVLAAVRASGHADLAGVGAVVLETDGSLSVLTEPHPVGEGAMRNVHPPGAGAGG